MDVFVISLLFKEELRTMCYILYSDIDESNKTSNALVSKLVNLSFLLTGSSSAVTLVFNGFRVDFTFMLV